MTTSTNDSHKSNYGAKKAFLSAYNRRPLPEGDLRTEPKTGRVWGFDFPIGQKPWSRR